MNLSLKKGNALVVVAHPDDETIWMGGTILSHLQINWTIFSLCRASDSDRAPRFKRVVKFLGARGIISDLEDEGKMSIADSVPEIKKRLLRGLGRKRFTYIFTHAYNGEYGHPRHKGVRRAVQELIADDKIKTDNLFYFSYKPDERKGFAVPNKKGAIISKLSQNIFKQKQKAIHELYGFSKSSFEYKSCSQLEAFKRSAWASQLGSEAERARVRANEVSERARPRRQRESSQGIRVVARSPRAQTL